MLFYKPRNNTKMILMYIYLLVCPLPKKQNGEKRKKNHTLWRVSKETKKSDRMPRSEELKKKTKNESNHSIY